MGTQQNPPLKANILDRVLAYFSPQSGAQRLFARQTFNSILSGSVNPMRRRSASVDGTLAHWHPRRESDWAQNGEMDETMKRAESLVANDGHATACIDALSLNIVGAGLNPESYPNVDALKISDKVANEFSNQAEHVWQQWAKSADFTGAQHFNDMQYVAIRSLLVCGEFLHIPAFREDEDSGLGFKIRAVHPARLRTPSDMLKDENVRCGIRFDPTGYIKGYYIANPTREHGLEYLDSKYFTYIPKYAGKRLLVFHGARPGMPEAVRGVSVLSPAMKMFRDLGDYMDYELVGALVASSYSVFIETPTDIMSGASLSGGMDNNAVNAAYPKAVANLAPGTITLGEAGHKPHILSSPRPSNSFGDFYEKVLRAVAASTGQPYESVAKDFSKTNYSSARAALLEVWKMYALYQEWFVRFYLNRIWEYVMEEAFLRNMLPIPKGITPYDGDGRWEHLIHCIWTRPARGQIDPVKERQAELLALQSFTETRSSLCHGKGYDFATVVAQRAKEEQLLERAGLVIREPSQAEGNPRDVIPSEVKDEQ